MPSQPNSDPPRAEGPPPGTGGHAAERLREQMQRDLGRAGDEGDAQSTDGTDTDSDTDTDTKSDSDAEG